MESVKLSMQDFEQQTTNSSSIVQTESKGKGDDKGSTIRLSLQTTILHSRQFLGRGRIGLGDNWKSTEHRKRYDYHEWAFLEGF